MAFSHFTIFCSNPQMFHENPAMFKFFQQAPTQQTLNHNIMFYEEPAMFHLGWISLCKYYKNSTNPIPKKKEFWKSNKVSRCCWCLALSLYGWVARFQLTCEILSVFEHSPTFVAPVYSLYTSCKTSQLFLELGLYRGFKRICSNCSIYLRFVIFSIQFIQYFYL